MTLAVIACYLGLVLVIGTASSRVFRGTGEDYFLATRSIGPFILLMSLFGTHMTAFSLLGASGEAYREGLGVFALMASSSAIVVPLIFLFVGTRLWALGKRHAFATQAQLFRERFQSESLGLVLFVVTVALVVPYLLIGVMGGGQTLARITGGQIPEWLGGLVITLVVLIYVTTGGLRGTAWANTFQTLVFMTLGALTFVVLVKQAGGLGVAFDRVAAERPDLLARSGHLSTAALISYTFVPLSAGMFPHLFMHWLSARRVEAFRLSILAYPLCVAVVWLPSVTLGVLGRLDFPDLQGPAASSVLIRMIHANAPELLAGLLAAGVLAAVMSSLDSQVLSLSNMFSIDIVRHFGFHDRMSERAQVLAGRLFVVLILLVTYALSLIADTTLFGLAVWSFSGFAGLFPLVVAALYWRRATLAGAFAAIATVVALWLILFFDSRGQVGYSVLGTGLQPVVAIVLGSVLALVLVSLASRPPPAEVVDRFVPRRSGP